MNGVFINDISDQQYSEESFMKLRRRPLSYTLRQEDYPWKSNDREYDQGIPGLHSEISDFFDYIKPNAEEQYAREVVVLKITDIVQNMWPDCKVDVFGSFKTGLYLPTSDIDMVIFGKWDALPLMTLEKALSRSGISSEIKVLDRASVPIVKMTDKETDIQVDISFNMMNSVRAAELIQHYIRMFPCLPHLVFVLKQFLLQRSLNEVWTGGLSSYALILMVVRYLQQTVAPGWPLEKTNLGTLLLEFFELYGRLFNYAKTAILVTDGGGWVQKDRILQNMGPSARQSILCIVDPLSPGNDVGRRSYQALLVKRAFEYAYVVMSSAVIPQYLLGRKEKSVLGHVIRISEDAMKCRQRIRAYGRRLLAPVPHVTTTKTDSQNGYSETELSAPPSHTQSRTVSNPDVPSTAHHLSHASSVDNDRVGTRQTSPSSQRSSSASRSSRPMRSISAEPSKPDALGRDADVSPGHTKSLVTMSDAREKRGEYSVLAEDFASLSTLMTGELGAKSSLQPPPHSKPEEDIKRRCLRPLSPHNCSFADSNAHCESSSSQNNDASNSKAITFKRTDVTSSSPAPPVGANHGRTRKQPPKPPHMPGGGVPTMARENQFPPFVNLSTASGHKRHATGSTRRSK